MFENADQILQTDLHKHYRKISGGWGGKKSQKLGQKCYKFWKKQEINNEKYYN